MKADIPETDVFVLLAERRRRLALRVLRRASGPLTVTELTERIGNRECQTPSDEQLNTIEVALYHNHLPRLEEADVVRYDRDEGTVSLDGNFDVLVRVLSGVTERDEPWSSD